MNETREGATTAVGDESRPLWLLPAIVIAQWMVTSLWFATNAVIGSMQELWGTSGGEGIVTAAVQLGFIAGTLSFAVLGVADRFRAPTVFFVCALLGAAANLSVLIAPESFTFVLLLRFLVGFFLAGVYPVGMRIAAGWYAGGLGRALGFLVGALVLGTASPHLLRALGADWDWQLLVVGTSLLALAGGLLVWRVPEGPHLARRGAVRFRGVLAAFRNPRFRASSFGYFGHMWELYAFWAFAPVWIATRDLTDAGASWLALAVIAMGFLGCAGGGLLVERFGGGRVALGQLRVSGVCCLASPVMLYTPLPVFATFLLVWGIAVAGDSPQFSALTAQFAPRDVVGSALTLVNSVGFAITTLSLSLLEWLQYAVGVEWLLLPLALGPLFGLATGRRLFQASS